MGGPGGAFGSLVDSFYTFPNKDPCPCTAEANIDCSSYDPLFKGLSTLFRVRFRV